MTRIAPDWAPGGTNKDLGEFAKRQQDGWQSCEDDKAAIEKYVEDYKAQHGSAP